MRAIALRVSVICLILIPFTAQGHEARFGGTLHAGAGMPPAPAQAAAPEPLSPEKMIFSVVKIVNKTANVFSADPSGGHGTGFLVHVDRQTGKGLIFTNRHVIESTSTQAQELTVEFNTPQSRPETVRAKLVYVSNLHDFAVLEFDSTQLKRAVLDSPLRLPDPQSPFYEFVQNAGRLNGLQVLAIGNPFDGSNIMTLGYINGMKFDEVKGPFIQTQTPINPGNSGGPLISADTGEVVGINTAKLMGADNVGYATPIGPVMKEFSLWMQQRAQKISPTAADPRVLTFKSGVLGESNLKLLGLHGAVEQAVPGYWENYRTVLVVTDTMADNGLKKDDILLRLDGEVIGGYPYNLFKRLQKSGTEVQMTILRDGKMMIVDVPFPNAGYHWRRQQVDYVYISGLILKELAIGANDKIHPGMKSGVMVEGMVNSAAVNFRGMEFPPPGSIIAAVNFGGEDYEIRNLYDLKMALNQNRDKKFVKLRAYRSNLIMDNNGVRPLFSSSTSLPLVDGVQLTFIIPMREVLTPFQFSIHKFRKQFSFEASDAHTWDWRDHRNPGRLPTSCQELLAKAPAGVLVPDQKPEPVK